MNLKPISEDPNPFIASVESAGELQERLAKNPMAQPRDPRRSGYARLYTKGFKPGPSK